jgi:hypothetical protein
LSKDEYERQSIAQGKITMDQRLDRISISVRHGLEKRVFGEVDRVAPISSVDEPVVPQANTSSSKRTDAASRQPHGQNL